MPLFAYRARDQKGILVKGIIEGAAREMVRINIAEQGLIPIAVEPTKASNRWWQEFHFFKKIKPEEIVLLTRQFHTLFKAGMSMESLLATLVRQTQNTALREVLQRIQTDIQEGSTLAHAFAKHSKVFNELYISMLSAGEEAGILEEVLKNLSELLQKEIEIQQNIKSAMLYPKIVIGVLTSAIFVMLTWVIPQLVQFYAHYKATLPLPTLLLMQASTLVRDYGWTLLLFGLVVYILFKRYDRTPHGKLRMDQLRWKIPIFGTLSKKIANARFAHLLASLYRSGLPITKSLGLMEKVMENEVICKELRTIQSNVERGQGIAEAMQQTTSFAPMLIEATAIGEKTGSLDDMLQGLANHYDTEIEHTTKNLTTLLEPFLLILIFGMVAFFALSIFLPIWNISKAVIH